MNEGRGFFEIGVWHPKSECNIGTLWRSAWQFGAAGIFTVGQRYRSQASDTAKAWRHVPLRCYRDVEEMWSVLPHDAPVIAVEMGGKGLRQFHHPQRAIYLLGAEDHGLPQSVVDRCHKHVAIEAVRWPSLNVAVAGSIVMWDRIRKAERGEALGEGREVARHG